MKWIQAATLSIISAGFGTAKTSLANENIEPAFLADRELAVEKTAQSVAIQKKLEKSAKAVQSAEEDLSRQTGELDKTLALKEQFELELREASSQVENLRKEYRLSSSEHAKLGQELSSSQKVLESLLADAQKMTKVCENQVLKLHELQDNYLALIAQQNTLTESMKNTQERFTITVASKAYPDKTFSRTDTDVSKARRLAMGDGLAQYSDCEIVDIKKHKMVSKEMVLNYDEAKRLARLHREVKIPDAVDDLKQARLALDPLIARGVDLTAQTESLQNKITEVASAAADWKDKLSACQKRIESLREHSAATKENLSELNNACKSISDFIAKSNQEEKETTEALSFLTKQLSDIQNKQDKRLAIVQQQAKALAALEAPELGKKLGRDSTHNILMQEAEKAGAKDRLLAAVAKARKEAYQRSFSGALESKDKTELAKHLSEFHRQIDAWADQVLFSSEYQRVAKERYRRNPLTKTQVSLRNQPPISESDQTVRVWGRVMLPDPVKGIFDPRELTLTSVELSKPLSASEPNPSIDFSDAAAVSLATMDFSRLSRPLMDEKNPYSDTELASSFESWFVEELKERLTDPFTKEYESTIRKAFRAAYHNALNAKLTSQDREQLDRIASEARALALRDRAVQLARKEYLTAAIERTKERAHQAAINEFKERYDASFDGIELINRYSGLPVSDATHNSVLIGDELSLVYQLTNPLGMPIPEGVLVAEVTLKGRNGDITKREVLPALEAFSSNKIESNLRIMLSTKGSKTVDLTVRIFAKQDAKQGSQEVELGSSQTHSLNKLRFLDAFRATSVSQLGDDPADEVEFLMHLRKEYAFLADSDPTHFRIKALDTQDEFFFEDAYWGTVDDSSKLDKLGSVLSIPARLKRDHGFYSGNAYRYGWEDPDATDIGASQMNWEHVRLSFGGHGRPVLIASQNLVPSVPTDPNSRPAVSLNGGTYYLEHALSLGGSVPFIMKLQAAIRPDQLERSSEVLIRLVPKKSTPGLVLQNPKRIYLNPTLPRTVRAADDKSSRSSYPITMLFSLNADTLLEPGNHYKMTLAIVANGEVQEEAIIGFDFTIPDESLKKTGHKIPEIVPPPVDDNVLWEEQL